MTITLPENAERWATLCEKYKALNKERFDAHFSIGRLSAQLGTKLSLSCGCDAKNIRHYTYSFATTPDQDKYSKVDSPWESVTRDGKNWIFGLGVLLEETPDTYPKMVFVMPVEVSVAPDYFELKSSIYDGSERVPRESGYEEALARVAERMFEGINRCLDNSIEPRDAHRRIGFHNVTSG